MQKTYTFTKQERCNGLISLQLQINFIGHVSVVTYVLREVIYIQSEKICEINVPFIVMGSHGRYVKRGCWKSLY